MAYFFDRVLSNEQITANNSDGSIQLIFVYDLNHIGVKDLQLLK